MFSLNIAMNILSWLLKNLLSPVKTVGMCMRLEPLFISCNSCFVHYKQKEEIELEAEMQGVNVRITTDNIHLEGSQEGLKQMRGAVDQILLQFMGRFAGS